MRVTQIVLGCYDDGLRCPKMRHPEIQIYDSLRKNVSMQVVITGGGGFLGAQLCKALLGRGSLENQKGDREPIEQILLVDQRFSKTEIEDRVSQVEVDISNRTALFDVLPAKKGVSFFSSCIDGKWRMRRFLRRCASR